MTWSTFTFVYGSVSLMLLGLLWRYLRDKTPQVVAVQCCSVSVGFLFDYIGNDRSIWQFPELSGLFILQNPIENTIFIAATTNVLLFVDILCRKALRFKNQKTKH